MRAHEFVTKPVKEDTQPVNTDAYKDAIKRAETPKKKSAKSKVELLQRIR